MEGFFILPFLFKGGPKPQKGEGTARESNQRLMSPPTSELYLNLLFMQDTSKFQSTQQYLLTPMKVPRGQVNSLVFTHQLPNILPPKTQVSQFHPKLGSETQPIHAYKI